VSVCPKKYLNQIWDLEHSYRNEIHRTIVNVHLISALYFINHSFFHCELLRAPYTIPAMKCNLGMIYNYAGMRVGIEYLTESVQKLPQELVIPNDQIRILDSIGQGELGS